MLGHVANFCCDEEGATAVEYGLIAALVSMAAFGAMVATASSVSQMFNYVTSEVGIAVNP